jgi:hypothetical protein
VIGRQLIHQLRQLQGHRAQDHPIQAAGQQVLGPGGAAHPSPQLHRDIQGGGDRLDHRIIHRLAGAGAV